MNWITTHKDELQAISGIAISILTLVLIILTGIYARANWRTMRLMEADLRFRSRPIPHVWVGVQNISYGNNITIDVSIRTTNAALKIKSLKVHIYFPDDTYRTITFNGLRNRYLLPQENITPHSTMHSDVEFTSFRSVFVFTDLAGLAKYVTKIDDKNHLTTKVYPIFNTSPVLAVLAKCGKWIEAIRVSDSQ